MRALEKTLYTSFIITVQLMQFALILSIAAICGKIIEFLTMYVSFFCSHTLFGKPYHADTITRCTMESIVIFGLLILATLPITISIVFQTFLGVSLSLVMSLIVKPEEPALMFVESKRKALLRSKIKTIDVNTINNLACLSERERLILIDLYVEGFTLECVAERHHYSIRYFNDLVNKILAKL